MRDFKAPSPNHIIPMPPIKIDGKYGALFDYIQRVLLSRGLQEYEISIIIALADNANAARGDSDA